MPNGSANVSFSEAHEGTSEHSEWSHSLPRGLSKSVAQIMGLLVEKLFWESLSYSVFSCMCWYHCSVCLQCSQVAAKRDTSMLVKPLADPSGHRGEKGVCKIVRDSHRRWCVGGGHLDTTAGWLKLGPGNKKLLIPPHPWNVYPVHQSHCGTHF